MIKIDDLIGIDGNNVQMLPKYRGFLPYFSSFQDITFPIQLPATGTIYPPLIIQGPKNNAEYGANQAEYMVYADSTDGANAAWTLQLKDMNGREYMNRPIHIRAIAGSAQQPALIYEPFFLRSRETLYVQLNKLTAGTANIRFYMPGVLYDPQSAIPNQKEIEDYIKIRSKFREQVYPYWQTTEQDVSLVGNSSDNEYDVMLGENFEAFNITAVSTGNFSFRLSDVRSGQDLMNGTVTNTNGLGDGSNPFEFVDPYLMLQGTRLRFTFNELSGSTNNIYIAIQGRRILAPVTEFKDAVKPPYWLQNNNSPYIRPQIVGSM